MKILAKSMPALLLALAACGGGGDDASTPDASSGADVQEVSCTGATIAVTFTTSGFAYSPASDTISVGEIVRFSPEASHDVVSNDSLFSVGLGGDGCFQFNTAGTYVFHCTPHGFTGTLTVE
jgi:plastocyanin